MYSFRHHISIALLGLGLAVWSIASSGLFFASFLSVNIPATFPSVTVSGDQGVFDIDPEKLLDQDYVFETGSDSKATLKFPGNAVIRLSPNSKLHIRQSPVDSSYSLDLSFGKIWVHTLYAPHMISLNFGSLRIPASNRSIFTVSASADTFTFIPVRAPLLLDISGNRSFLFPSQAVSFLTVDTSFSSPEYEILSPRDFSQNVWFQENISQDENFHSTLLKTYSDRFIDRGLAFSKTDGLLYDLRTQARDQGASLILNDDKRSQFEIDFVLSIFDDGLYFLKNGDTTEAQKRFDIFDEQAVPFQNNFDFLNAFEQRFLATHILHSSDVTFFPVREKIRSIFLKYLFSQHRPLDEVRMVLDSYFDDISSAASFDPFLAQDLFRSYIRFTATLTFSAKNDPVFKEFFVSFFNASSFLFKSNLSLYKDVFFADISKVEERVLDLFPDLKSHIDDVKNDILRSLRQQFFAEKISAEIVRPIILVLGKDFPEQDTFLAFLRSGYVSSSFYGDNFKDRFSAFQKSQKERIDVTKLSEDYSGIFTEDENKQIQDVLKDTELFLSKAQIQGVSFGSFVDVHQRFIPIEKAKIRGIEFSAIYDTDQKLLSDIQVGGQIILKTPLRPESVFTLLEPQKDVPQSSASENGSSVSQTKTEKVALLYVADYLTSLGFQVQPGQIRVLNVGRKQFLIFGALLPHGKEKIFVNFSFDLLERKIFNATFKTLGGAVTMDGSSAADEFPGKLVDRYEKSFYEQVGKELKKGK